MRKRKYRYRAHAPLPPLLRNLALVVPGVVFWGRTPHGWVWQMVIR